MKKSGEIAYYLEIFPKLGRVLFLGGANLG
jgi:hypothetical protein